MRRCRLVPGIAGSFATLYIPAMKSLITLLFLTLSVFFAGRQAHDNTNGDTSRTYAGKSFFSCTIDGNRWASTSWTDSTSTTTAGLSVAWLHGNADYMQPCGLLINAAKKESSGESYFYIQPLSEAAAVPLPLQTNIYNSIYITYKTAGGRFYSTNTSPGNFEITQIDTVHRYLSGRFNCILYSSLQDDYILVTNGKFRFRLTEKPLVMPAENN